MSRSFVSPTAAVTAALLSLAAPAARAQGLEKWEPKGVPVATSFTERVSPVAVPDGAGGAFVVWQQLGMLRMQRLTAQGRPAPGWNAGTGVLVCSEANRGGWMQSSPRAISDGAGGAYVLWMDMRNWRCSSGCIGDPRQIFLTRIDGDGRIAEGWPALGVDVGSALGRMNPQPAGRRGYPHEMNPVLVPDELGGALIAWTEATQSIGTTVTIPGIHVQRISPAGERLWGERGLVVSPTQAPIAGWPTTRVAYPSIAPDGEGGAFVAWQDERDGAAAQIYVQHVSADGRPLIEAEGSRFSEGGDAAGYPQVIALEKGGALVVWQSGPRTGAVSLWAKVLVAREPGRAYEAVLVTESAKPEGSASLLPESEVALIADEKKGAWVSWIDVRDAEHPAIYLQHLRKDGGPAGGWPEGGLAVCDGWVAKCSRPALVVDEMHGVYVGWRDATGPRVVRVSPDATFARGWPHGGLPLSDSGLDVGFHMVSDGAAGGVIVWDQFIGSTGVEDVRAQRVGPAASSLRGYARRGAAEEQAALGAVSPRFALGGFEPNPASAGPLAIAFSLPSSDAASLEIFDLAGRRVLHREVGSLGAGAHRVPLGAAALRPGVYQIRLTQAERRLTMRGIVTR